MAAFNGHGDVVAQLLAHGAACDAAIDGGYTPLMVSAHFGHARCVQALLEAGADVHAVGGNGKSAIETAAANGKASIVELLQAVSVSKA